MKNIFIACICIFCLSITLIAQQQKAQIIIKDNNPNPYKLNRLLFGGFLEMLNDYVNGSLGLWHQELRDRGFDWDDNNNDGISDYWISLYDGNYAQTDGGYNENGLFSQKMINDNSSDISGVAQEVFISDTVSHLFYVYLKGEIAEESSVYVRLYDHDSRDIIYEQELIKPKNIWEKDSVNIPAFENKNHCYLSIELHGKGYIDIDEASLTPSNSIDGFRREYYDLIRDCGLSILRYPGGWFADNPGNDWRLGIGDIDKRKAALNCGIKQSQRLDFGTDEYMKFCNNLNIEPHIVVNYARNNPQEAAAWVEYLNGTIDTEFGKLRADNGTQAPYNVKYFEIGNEQWSDEYEMTQRYLQYYDAMIEKNPNISIMVDGNLWGGMDNFHKIMGEIGKKCQIFGWHITQVGHTKEVSDPENIFKIMVGASHNHIMTISNYQNALIYNDYYPDVLQGCTEWWTEYDGQKGSIMDTSLKSGSLEVGLCDAAYLQTFMMFPQTMILGERTFGLTFLKSGIDPITKKKAIFGSPSYHAFSMLSNYSGETLIPTEVICNKYNTEPVEGLYTLHNVPFIQTLVTSTKDTMYISIVNRSPADSISIDLTFYNKVFQKNGKVYELYSDNYLDANTAENPLNILPYSYDWELSDVFTIKPHCFSIIALAYNQGINIPITSDLNETRAYPNPFNDKVFLEVHSIDSLIDNIKVFDIMGKEIETEVSYISNSTLQIDFDNISDGIYFISVFSGTGYKVFTLSCYQR